MKKKLMSLDDLYSYYVTKSKSVHFTSKNDNTVLAVQVEGNLSFEKEEDSPIEGLLPVTLQACHTGTNLNGSHIENDVMEKALESFKNRPILGYIHEVDGEYEFYGHNIHLDEDDNIVYDEIPVGVVPESCNARIEYDEDKEKDYVVVDGYIYEDYTQAANILRKNKECAVSVELGIRDLSYDAKEKVLNIENFVFSGVTILGVDEDGNEVKPGMANSNIKLSDFSVQNNSMFTHTEINEKLIETLDKLNTTLSNFNKDDDNHQFEQKGGQEDMSKFEELLEKYGKTDEDIEFEHEGMSDEELEAKFAEMFDEGDDASSDEADDGDSSAQADEGAENAEVSTTTSEDGKETNSNPSGGDDTDSTQSNPKQDEEEVGVSSDDEETKKKKYSFTSGDKTYTFELSLNDKVCALSDLVNATYAEADNTWYGVTVYESYVVMNDWWNGKYFKQSYEQDGETFSLTGDREEVFINYLTKDEEVALAEMKANYSALESELNTYKEAESNAQKDAIFATDYYQEFLETNEFKSLMEEKDKYSVEELKDKAELAFAKCVREKGTFSAKGSTKQTFRKMVGSPKKDIKKNPYGTILKDKD